MNNGLKPWHKILIVLIVLYFIYAVWAANKMFKSMDRRSNGLTDEPMRIRMVEGRNGEGRNGG